MPDNISVPDQEHFESVIAWGREAIQEGEAFLKSQFGFDKIDKTVRMIMGDSDELRSSQLSRVSSNRLGYIAQTLAASLTDTKPFWEFRTHNKRFEQTAQLANKLGMSWWLQRQIDMKFAGVIKYALAAGAGYAHLFYNQEIDDLDVHTLDPRDVLPIRPYSSEATIQECFGVLTRSERSVNYLLREYPKAKGKIKADREGSIAANLKSSRYETQMERLGLTASPFWSWFKKTGGASPSIPMTDVYTCYVKDRSVNKSGFPVLVGEKPMQYEVAPGKLLYPRLRRLVFTSSALISDGPSPNWHGMFPLNKLTLDPWPFAGAWLGKAPLLDLLPLQEELTRLLRVVADRNQKVAREHVIADSNAMPRSQWNAIDPRLPMKLRVNPMGRPPVIQGPPPLDAGLVESIKFLIDEMDTLSGVKDVTSMSKLGQIPSSETIDKILEAMSPVIRARSRVMEAFLRDFAIQVLSGFMQFYSLPMRLAKLGSDGMTFEDFDSDPGTLVPDYIDETDFDSNGLLTWEAKQRGPGSRDQRAVAMLKLFTYHIAPGSLLSASEITRQMMYVMLSRAGLIDHWTLLEILAIPNVGEPKGNTITERLIEEQEMGLGMAISSSGRKATGQEQPRMVIKES